MLSENSVLCRVPANVEKKQAFFIDGIRHAIEIMDLAYSRLRDNLTKLARTSLTPAELRALSPHIFLDAWAMVDASDRFRVLYQQFPGMTRKQAEGTTPLSEVLDPVRKVRNIGDHLTQTADQVIARNGAALGILTWVTGIEIDPVKLWFCTLRPGTLREEPKFNLGPICTAVEWPTDRICLSTAGHEVNLSEIRPHIELRVKHLEKQLEAQFERDEFKQSFVANDVFHKLVIVPAPGQSLGQNE